MVGEGAGHFGEGYGVADLAGDGGDSFVGEAAGVDEGEGGEVSADVEGEAVHGDVAAALYADGADFSLRWGASAYPYTGGSIYALTCDAVVGDGAYHGFLKEIDVAFDAEVMALKVDDGVDH